MRKQTSHKTENGVVLIVGGSEEFVGAPALAGLAALRAGADLSIIAAPEKTSWAISSMSPDLITIKCKGSHLTQKNMKQVMDAAEKADVILLGNGLSKKSLSFAKSLVKKIKDKQKVVDADALKAVSFEDLENSIITPHMKELEWLFFNIKKK
ncbi:MAG: NAD(P)H-hydrate dehydratase [Candidatus Nanoarchaeia archaeon]